jgi:leader peptidase (prepilin peptidase) / N-methyltransferase
MSTVLMFTIVIAGLLIAISVIDIRQLRIPDVLNVFLLVSGLLYWVVQNPEMLPYQIVNGAVVAALLWLLRSGYAQLSGRIGLGLGDVKMVGAGSVWISPQSVPMLIFIASFCGLVFVIVRGVSAADGRIPFGPFLALGLISVWFMENIA